MCSCTPSEGQGPRPPTMVRMTSADRRLRRVNPAAPYIRSMGIPRTHSQSRTPDFPRRGLIAVGEALYGARVLQYYGEDSALKGYAIAGFGVVGVS